jgi:arylformamidase
METRRRFVDLSHTVEHGMVTYQGFPPPVISEFLSREDSRAHYEGKAEFQVGRIDLVANTGTYIDSPFHRYRDGADLAGLPLERIADLEGLVVRASGARSAAGALTADRPHAAERAVSRDLLEQAVPSPLIEGRAVLIHTGWSAHWRTERYFQGHPFLTEGAVRYLAEAGAALVGIDSYNIDDTGDPRRPAHTLLLAAGIPIVEHLRGLHELPDGPFRFYAVPVKIRGMGSFPVRAFAVC